MIGATRRRKREPCDTYLVGNYLHCKLFANIYEIYGDLSNYELYWIQRNQEIIRFLKENRMALDLIVNVIVGITILYLVEMVDYLQKKVKELDRRSR